MATVSCPVCGDEGFVRTYEQRSVRVPFGEKIGYMAACCVCHLCKSDGDFHLENDAKVNVALAASRQTAAVAMLENLSKHRIQPSYIERVLGIPQGSTKMWQQSVTPEAAALLTVLVMNPDVLDAIDRMMEDK